MSSPAGTLLAGLVPDGRNPPDRAPTDHAVMGSWSATRWQYASREHPDRMVDVVCDLGGTVTLSLSAGTYVLAWEVAGQGRQSIGGALVLREDRIELIASGAQMKETVRYRLAADTMALSSEASSWAFDGQGEESADFVAVLVRL